MKNIFLLLMLGLALTTFAQIGIETIEVHASAVLDFPTGQNKGIILPMVETLPSTNLVNGTFVFDKADGIVKIRQNNAWVNLTKGGFNLTGSAYDLNSTAEIGNGVIIGSSNPSSVTTNGVLVLESTNKGLMLPKVADPHLNVKSPYPGFMCYDTAKKAVAFFDGTGWYYWK